MEGVLPGNYILNARVIGRRGGGLQNCAKSKGGKRDRAPRRSSGDPADTTVTHIVHYALETLTVREACPSANDSDDPRTLWWTFYVRCLYKSKDPRAFTTNAEQLVSADRLHTALRKTTWSSGGYELKAELAKQEDTKEALHVERTQFVLEEPLTICGELVAYRLLAFINYVLWQLDNLVTYLSAGFLLLVIAMNSYDFRSGTIIDWIVISLFGLMTVGIVAVFSQAARDAILSRISGTEEGKLDRHFFTHLISYGALPVIVLAATHFPTVGRFFFSWIKPALEAIH